MRIIKFRAWDKDLRKMISGLETKPGNTLHLDREHSDIILTQFTGLKDKNGEEIYEGDIVVSVYKEEKGTDTCVVEWASGLAGWLLDTRFPGSLGTYQLNIHCSDKYEVIGNIYENPELLNLPTTSEET